MRWMPFVFPFVLVAVSAGCCHRHAMVAVDVADVGEHVRTKYRYYVPKYLMTQYQPEVFSWDSAESIPMKLETTDVEKGGIGGGWTMLFMVLSCNLLPSFETCHRHVAWSCRVASDDRDLALQKARGGKMATVTGELCARGGDSLAVLPFPMLFFNFDWDLCFSGRTFNRHAHEVMGTLRPIDSALCDEALAYALAVRLKALEDDGTINDEWAAEAKLRGLMTASSLSQKRAQVESLRRGGVEIDLDKVSGGQCPLEIVLCENEPGRDYVYRFELKRRGDEQFPLADYTLVRNSFRNMIRSQYVSEHPEKNARALVVDFPEFELNAGRIMGRVAVMTIETLSLSYDAATRKGLITARIGENQFEDVRRYLRKNIEEVARRNNVALVGDVIPEDARFYIGRETLKENGILELEFKTE